jgi:hypothetical protein
MLVINADGKPDEQGGKQKGSKLQMPICSVGQFS